MRGRAACYWRTGRGEATEIVDHDTALGGRQPLQFLPARHLQPAVGILEPRAQRRRQQHAVAIGSGALPLLLLVLLLALQRPPGIEHAAEQLFLPLHRLPVEPASLQPLRQLLGLVGHLAGAGHVALAAQLLQLLRQRALLRRQLLQLLLRTTAGAHLRYERGPLLAQLALLLRQLPHLLHCFGQARPRLRSTHVAAGAEQPMRGRIERVERITGAIARLARIGIGRGDRIARLLHEAARRGQRSADLR